MACYPCRYHISYHSYHYTVSDPGTFPESRYDGRCCKGLNNENDRSLLKGSEKIRTECRVSGCMENAWNMAFLCLGRTFVLCCLQDRYRDVIMTPEKKGGNNMSIYDTLNPKQKRQSYIQTALFLYWQAPVPERQGS